MTNVERRWIRCAVQYASLVVEASYAGSYLQWWGMQRRNAKAAMVADAAAAVAGHEYGRVSCFGPEHEGPRTNERPRPRGILARSALIMAGKTYARTVYDELAVRCEVSPRKAPA